MGVRPTKPRYTCDNCLYGDKPGVVPCAVCPVMDSPTMTPKKWEPRGGGEVVPDGRLTPSGKGGMSDEDVPQ